MLVAKNYQKVKGVDVKFPMSKYANTEEMYKAKAEYFENKCKESKWISVEDEMPKYDTLIIALTENNEVLYDMLLADNGPNPDTWMTRCTLWSGGNVTHWQPQLKPPKGG